MNYQLLMDMAVKVGEMMLSHGAEAHRVEDTVYRILKTSNLQTTEVFVIMTGMFATLSDPSIDTITVTKRVRNKGNNLKQICYANEISRQYCDGVISLEEAYELIKEGCSWEYTRKMSMIGNIMIVTTFPLLVGGTLTDCGVAFLASLIVGGSIFWADKSHIHPFLRDLAISFLAAVTFVALDYLLPFAIRQDAIIIACIMPLVPGVAITNAIRDTLNGDYVSGAARALEAFIKALAIALGVGIGLLVLGGVRV
jgi:uncharacterized membrane protein YjjP (DUF1212 family)